MKPAMIPALVLILFSSAALYPESSLTSAEFTPKVKLTKKDGYGAKAVVKNLVLKGMKGKTVMLQFVLYSEKGKLSAYAMEYLTLDGDNYKMDELVLEISDPEAIAVFGEGLFNVYAIFQVIRMDNMECLWPVRVVKEIQIELKKDPKDTIKLEELKKWHTPEMYEIEKTYGIDILYGDFKGGYKVKETGSYENVTEKSKKVLTEKTFPDFIEAIKRYPPEFVKKSGLKGVVFVDNIIFMKQKVGGHFDVCEKLIFLPLNTLVSHAFAHEYFHFMEAFFSPDMNMNSWKSLNIPGFEYKNSSPNNLVDSKTFMKHPEQGFLNGYCMNDPFQDRAEVFASIMTPADYKMAAEWIKNDPYLAKKFEKIRWELKSFYGDFFNYYDPEKWIK